MIKLANGNDNWKWRHLGIRRSTPSNGQPPKGLLINYYQIINYYDVIHSSVATSFGHKLNHFCFCIRRTAVTWTSASSTNSTNLHIGPRNLHKSCGRSRDVDKGRFDGGSYQFDGRWIGSNWIEQLFRFVIESASEFNWRGTPATPETPETPATPCDALRRPWHLHFWLLEIQPSEINQLVSSICVASYYWIGCHGYRPEDGHLAEVIASNSSPRHFFLLLLLLLFFQMKNQFSSWTGSDYAIRKFICIFRFFIAAGYYW